MGKHRSLNEAIDVDTEVQQFIEQGRPAEHSKAANEAVESPRRERRRRRADQGSPDHEPPDSDSLAPTAGDVVDTSPKRRKSRKSSRSMRESQAVDAVGEMLVPLTTRIRKSTSNALTRAYLEQKLAGELPATQQAIVEEALQAWLKSHRLL